jgi:hypothetical protein
MPVYDAPLSMEASPPVGIDCHPSFKPRTGMRADDTGARPVSFSATRSRMSPLRSMFDRSDDPTLVVDCGVPWGGQETSRPPRSEADSREYCMQ